VTWQPEPDQGWPDGPGSDNALVMPAGPSQAPYRDGRLRHRARQFAFGMLLTAGLAGLALSAVGVAHQLLPRRFSRAQQRSISAWEMERRWRALPAQAIFPASVPYELSAAMLFATSNLTLDADRLGISPSTKCTAAVSGTAIRILSKHDCSAAMRATYVDSSGSMVATLAVAVLPSASAARIVARDLAGSGAGHPAVRTLRIAGTPAAGFGAAQRQLSSTADAGPYVIFATAGFSDGRRRMRLADIYLDAEMRSLANGLIHAAESALDRPVPVPSCPGAPGC
jgi:hypothetical protein